MRGGDPRCASPAADARLAINGERVVLGVARKAEGLQLAQRDLQRHHGAHLVQAALIQRRAQQSRGRLALRSRHGFPGQAVAPARRVVPVAAGRFSERQQQLSPLRRCGGLDQALRRSGGGSGVCAWSSGMVTTKAATRAGKASSERRVFMRPFDATRRRRPFRTYQWA